MSHTEALPPSLAQQRLWFLNCLVPDSGLYNQPIGWHVVGALDVDALRRAIGEIVRRHEVLRTAFRLDGEELVQVIHGEAPPDVDVLDLSAAAHPRQQAERELLAHASRPFDLARPSMLRAVAIRIADDEHLLQLTMHHVASDGASMAVLAGELHALYDAFRAGRPSPLPALPVQYAEYTSWQRDLLQGPALQEHLAYWKKVLHGAPALLELPLDRNRPATPGHCGAAVGVVFDAASTEGLHALCRAEQVTPFMVLAAVFNVLLHRYSRQDDVCIGYPVNGRGRPELRGLVGLFVNTLVLRTHVESGQTFRALLRNVRVRVLDGDEHQELPFEKLIEELNPQRSLSYSPLFQVMLSFNSADAGQAQTQDALAPQFEPLAPHSSVGAKLDLTLDLHASGDRVSGVMEFNTDIFDRATIERMVGHLQVLLRSAVDSPDSRLADLPMLDTAERERIAGTWNDTAVDFCADTRLHQMFEAQALRTPDALALDFGGQLTTYGELNARANQLAHHLRELGVVPDSLVAICTDRSPDMVVALLGVLKAGGAYLPLDPEYPRDRTSYMLGDANVEILLTQQRLLGQLPAHSARAICIDADWNTIARQPAANPINVARPQHLAYCIYTSGSTGRPKGVSITHFGLENYLHWSADAYHTTFDKGSVVQLPLVFDATVTCLFTPLISGKSIELLLPLDHSKLFDFVKKKQQIGLLKITPAHIDLICHGLNADGDAAEVGITVIGGDALTAAQTATWLRHFRNTLIVNEYGPTETVVGCCTYETREVPGTPSVPIGRPIANTSLYILDADLNLVPIGVSGELHIAGHGLARGYLNRPDLTAEKFVPNPFGASLGERMYKSGDLARYLPDGNIEYLGRLDNQVKVRGFRIELGEIEAAIGAHPAVREVVVLAREDRPGDKRLVAYVVGHVGALLSAALLRGHVQTRLPHYMVPVHWVFLDSLPLSINGKLERKSLPPPRVASARSAAEPSTPTEHLLVDMWADLLALECVGIHDNFFARGGHSLLIVRMAARLQARCQCEVTPRDVFHSPTIAQLAALLDAKMTTLKE